MKCESIEFFPGSQRNVRSNIDPREAKEREPGIEVASYAFTSR